MDQQGELRYTRNGAFTLNGQGDLSTLNGMTVLDNANMPINIVGTTFSVSENGNVYSDGEFVSKLGLVEFDNPAMQLERVSKNAMRPVDPNIAPSPAIDTTIRQRMLEGSNVNTVDSMVELIKISRQNELNSKMVTSIDETLGKAVNEIGRVS
jgi:flagellar basal-body rod protein FlgF